MRSHLRPTALTGLLLAACAIAAPGCTAEQEEDSSAGESAIQGSARADRLIDVPFYFAVPKAAMTLPLNRAGYPYPTLLNESDAVSAAGLRIIAVKQGEDAASKQEARRNMARTLGRSGELKAGDIVLSLRLELGESMAYPHIQMGSTHASLTYTDEAGAHNIDSPLDGGDFTNPTSQFDTAFFVGGVAPSGTVEAGVDTLHVVRPRAMTDARRASLNDWVKTLKGSSGRFNGQREQVKFQKDYLAPAYASRGLTPRQTVTKLGQILLETDRETKLPMYCSEFAWHMLALSACSQDEIRNAGADGAACVDPIFAPMQLIGVEDGTVGLAEGPLQKVLLAPAEAREDLIKRIFEGGNAGRLSSGHRAVAEAVAPLMAATRAYYGLRASGASAQQAAPAGAQLNAQLRNVGNYSPTAFIVQASRPEADRPADYVATLTFVNGAQYDKARRLAGEQRNTVLDGATGVPR